MRSLKAFCIMLQQINSLLNKKQKSLLVWILLLILLSALFETLGVAAVLPLIQVLLMPEKLMGNQYVVMAMDIFGLHSAWQLTILISITIIVLYLVKNAIMTLSAYASICYANNLNTDMSIMIMECYMQRPYEFFTTHTTSDIMRGVGNDANSVFSVVSCLLNIVTYTITTIFVSTFLFGTDVILAVSIISIGIACILLMVCMFRKRMTRLGIQNREANWKVSAITIQIVYGIKEIFMKQKRNYFLQKFKAAKLLQKKTSIGFAFLNSLPIRIIEFVSIFGIIVAVLIRISLGGDSTTFVSNLAVFALGGFKIMPYISSISTEITSLTYYKPGLEAAFKNITEVQKCTSHKNSILHDAEQRKDIEFLNKIEFKNVSWQYENGEEKIFSTLNLRINKGEIIGIVGESGAGKSTFSDILLGLYEPQEGTVEVDGMNIFQHPDVWSSMIGYVPQLTYLFDDSIKMNVAFGDAFPDDSKIWKSLEKASLREFVESLQDGLDTRVGERGIILSGGQRQRVAIARALYSEPQILVLDEATSALDNETEMAVMESIESLQGSMTMVIIAHRLTTLKKCDKIYRIESGVATEVDKETLLR